MLFMYIYLLLLMSNAEQEVLTDFRKFYQMCSDRLQHISATCDRGQESSFTLPTLKVVGARSPLTCAIECKHLASCKVYGEEQISTDSVNCYLMEEILNCTELSDEMLACFEYFAKVGKQLYDCVM